MFWCLVRRLAITLLVLGSVGAAVADPPCQLRQAVSLPIQWDTGRMLVPVTLDGHALPLMLDTGSSITSSLFPSAVAALDLHPREANRHFVLINGREIDQYVVLNSVDLGPIHTTARQFLAFPAPSHGSAAAGLLGPDIVRQFDLEIDPAHDTINLFLQDHCPGNVVYWTRNYTDTAAHIMQSGHILVPMVLDGKPLEALLDTGSDRTILSLTVARHSFDLEPDTPALVRIDEPAEGSTQKLYRHAFATLALAGVSIRNPTITIVQDKIEKTSSDKGEISRHELQPDEAVKIPDLILGMNVISKLRLYIAFKESHIYATAAGAK